MSGYYVDTGGLMRCCIETIHNHMAVREDNPQEGEILDCEHEEPGNQQIIFSDGAWRWNKKEVAQ